MSDTFSLPQLRTDLDELYTLLAELLEIDLVLDGLEARGMLGPLGQKATLTLGVTEPFQVLYQISGPAPTPFGGEPLQTDSGKVDLGFIAEARAQAAGFRAAAQVAIEEIVELLVRVRPEEFRAVAGVLVTLYLNLHGSMQEDFAGLRNEGADWEGESADAFFDGFYEPLVQIRENHLWAIDYLTSLTAYLKAVNDLGQHSLANLVGCALEVVQAQLHERHERHRGPSSAQALAFLTAATGIAGVIAFPFGVGVGVALGSISYMLGYAASQVPYEDERQETIEASSARELHAHLVTSLGAVTRRVSKEYDETHGHVLVMRSSISGMEGGDSPGGTAPSRVGVWLPRTPDLVAGPDLYHQTSGRGL